MRARRMMMVLMTALPFGGWACDNSNDSGGSGGAGGRGMMPVSKVARPADVRAGAVRPTRPLATVRWKAGKQVLVA